jgi:hypothetical protein
MPEYLSPGVYVEEIEIGAKPIEGVSTSTAGFVGMTERGPLNKPTLVTSFAEYQRTFGGYLGSDFVKGEEDYRFLPLAVEGFFSNGGQRAYISRVAQCKEDSTNCAKKAGGFLPNILGKQSSLSAYANAGDITLEIEDTMNLNPDDILLLRGEPSPEFLTYRGQTMVLKLDSSIKNDLMEGQSAITIMKRGSDTYTISSAVNSKSDTIVLDKLELVTDDIIVIVDDIKSEICVIKGIDTQAKSIKVEPLKHDHVDKTIVKKLAESQGPGIKVLATVAKDRDAVPVENVAVIANDAIKIGDNYFLVKSIVANASLVAEELRYNHKSGDKLTQLLPAIKVEAANEGKWGDRIQIIVKDSPSSTSKLLKLAPAGQNYLELDTIVGIENGTILKLSNGDYVSVMEVIKSETANKVVLDKDLLIDLSTDDKVSIAEFDINVLYDKYIETYKNLSLDHRHSRYINNVISPTTSNFITLKYPTDPTDPAQKILLQTDEGGPGWRLSGGKDGKPTSDEADHVYVGDDDPEPTKKTGLFALTNIDDISIVAVPGLSSTKYKNVQSKLINHCEIMGDRFAVLDSGRTEGKKGIGIDEIQNQRNLFDSKYAALYYPWISIFDPFSQQQIDAPPSGHVCGIYARSDTERGVHKAPANEVVRGALDLQEMDGGRRAIITKGQQDVLNPKGINCIRAFPGRGIRVWGARTISSDPLWRYVNVRRLFLYVEKSINDGTQWVVFEPNDEKLWARVKQTINQFLTTVWRSGALMGATQDEAFFVKCDRSTMTQADIDNGKLIVLIGIAPVKPAEFVIFRIAQVAKGSSISG